jgi:hypothetical protein
MGEEEGMYLPRSPKEGMGGRPPPNSSSSSAQLTGAGAGRLTGAAMDIDGMEEESGAVSWMEQRRGGRKRKCKGKQGARAEISFHHFSARATSKEGRQAVQ